MDPIKPKTFHYRVYWEDTDAGGVVYHARYLHFLERARSDYLLHLGFPQTNLKNETHRLFVVTRVETDFISPARLEDELSVSVCVEQLRRASMVFAQTIERVVESSNQSPHQAILAKARVWVACLDVKTFKPARLPNDLVAAIQNN